MKRVSSLDEMSYQLFLWCGQKIMYVLLLSMSLNETNIEEEIIKSKMLATPSHHFEEGLGPEILCSFSLLLKYDTNFVVGAIKSQGGYLCQKVYIMVVLVMDIHFMSI